MAVQRTTPEHQRPSQGADAVRDALIEAAERLCAERSPARVSVRDIAAEAGVNHGQVHHYFGSKEGLIARTLERIDAAITEQVVGESEVKPSKLVGVATARPGFLRMLAWALLEGGDAAQIGDLRFGRVLAERLQAEGWNERDALVVATQAMVITGGWALLNPAFVIANELNAEHVRAIEGALDGLVESLVSSPEAA